MSEEISKTADTDYCRFCGTANARFFGSAHTYVRWPADINDDDGVYRLNRASASGLDPEGEARH